MRIFTHYMAKQHRLINHLDVAGEYVRENLIESEPGIELILDTQVIDVVTCEPVPDVFIEIWGMSASQVSFPS